MTSPTFKPAARRATPLRVVFLGPTKGGKTTTALATALHLAKILELPPEKVGVIDTETVGEGDAAVSRSEQLEGEPCPCAECGRRGLILTGHQVLKLSSLQHSPDHYMGAIRQAIAVGITILVLDGASAWWDWCLQEVDRRSDVKNKQARWGIVTPKHEELLRMLTTFPGHLFVTCRAKEKVSIGEDGKPLDLGWQAVQREGFLFEFDAELWLHNGHARAVARSSSINERTWQKPGADLAASLLAWSRAGEAATARRQADLTECLKLIVALPPDKAALARAFLDGKGSDPTAPTRLLKRLQEEQRAADAARALAPEGPPAGGAPSATSPPPSAPSPSVAGSGAPPAIPYPGPAQPGGSPAGGAAPPSPGGDVPPAPGGVTPAQPVDAPPSNGPPPSAPSSPGPSAPAASTAPSPNPPSATDAAPGLTRPARRPRSST